MTFITRRTVATLLAGAATVAVAGAAQAESLDQIQESGTIRIAVANEIPYGYIDPDGEARGAGPDIAKMIVDSMDGVDDIEWVTTNFSSLIPGLEADRFDVAAAEMAVLPQRCQQVIYSEPNSTYGEGLLVATDNPSDVHTYADFAKNKDAKVAIMAGADQLEMLQKLGVAQDQMVTLSSNSDAISTIATGRADAYAATGLTANELAQKSDKVKLAEKFEDPVVDGEEVRSWGAFAFAKDNTALRDAFNDALSEIKGTDEWRQTLADYGFTEKDIAASSDRTTEELCSADS